MKVLYHEYAAWEYDFVIHDICNVENKEVECFSNENFKSFMDRSDIIDNNILIINYLTNIHDIIAVAENIRPFVIFYLSDEGGYCPEMTTLGKYTKLLLTHYRHGSYNYPQNWIQVPLGYCRYFLNSKLSSTIQQKPMRERQTNASFIGSMKSDRLKMVKLFTQNMQKLNIKFVQNNWNINNLPISPEQCYQIYSDSIFVICGRGNVSLDCFRIYEAIVAGAIPVVVGSPQEINTTFFYNNDIPPFIKEESWENAVIKCNTLLHDYDKLQQIQNDLLLWWKNRISLVNNSITSAISESA